MKTQLRSKILKILGLWPMVFVCDGARAEDLHAVLSPRPVLTSSLSGYDTSDGLQVRTLQVSYFDFMADGIWPFPHEPETGTGWLISTELHRVEFQADVRRPIRFRVGKLTKLGTGPVCMGSAGLDTVTSQREGGVSRAGGEVGCAGSLVAQKVWARLHLSRSLMGPEVGVWDLLEAGRMSAGVKTNIVYRPGERWRLIQRGSYFSQDDGVNRHQTSVDGLWGISTQVPWVWMGVGGEWLGYSCQGVGYWTPLAFSSWGPRLESTWPLIGEEARLSWGLALNRFQEESREPGTGFYSLLSLERGSRGSSLFKLSYERIESNQVGSLWKQDRLTLDVSREF